MPTFSKYHGNGNDFIIIKLPDESFEKNLAPKICDRNKGIGADGIILIDMLPDLLKAEVINADGSIAKNCGNGLRCIARWYFDAHTTSQEVIISLAGRQYKATKEGSSIEIAMGLATVKRANIALNDDSFHVSMGNEHIVFLKNGSIDDPKQYIYQKLSLIPKNYNVGLAWSDNLGEINSLVFEYGVGFTKSCGTGAMAASCAIAHKNAQGDSVFKVFQPGGSLLVRLFLKNKDEYKAIYEVFQSGSAEKIFTGEFW